MKKVAVVCEAYHGELPTTLLQRAVESTATPLDGQSLPAAFDAIAEHVVEIGYGVDLFGGDIDWVFHSAIGDSVIFQNHIAGEWVPVAWLAHGADIDHQLLFAEAELVVAFFGRNELMAFGEHARNVGVTLKAVAIQAAEEGVNLPLIVNVLREHILVGRFTGRAMHEQKSLFVHHARQFAEEIPAAIDIVGTAAATLELVACPIHGLQGDRVEAIGIDERRLIVIAKNGNLAAGHDFVEAFARIGSITYGIAKAIDLFHVLFGNISQYGF